MANKAHLPHMPKVTVQDKGYNVGWLAYGQHQSFDASAAADELYPTLANRQKGEWRRGWLIGFYQACYNYKAGAVLKYGEVHHVEAMLHELMMIVEKHARTALGDTLEEL